MKLLNHLQLALVILLLTDIATFDYKTCKSKKLTEGSCPRKKCILEKCASAPDGSSTCQKSNCAIRQASCGAKDKPCGGCAKEKQPSCQPKEPLRCPYCGQEMCPQQNPKGCPQDRPSGCPSCQQKPTCPMQKQKPGGAHAKAVCRTPQKGCPQGKAKPVQRVTKPRCPQQCEERPACPERCTFFRSFGFPSAINTKKGETPTKMEHKGKCGPRCPGGDACTGK